MNYVIAFCTSVLSGYIFGSVFDNKNSSINNAFDHSWKTGLSVFLRQVAHVLLAITVIALMGIILILVTPYDVKDMELKELELYGFYSFVLWCTGAPLGLLIGKFSAIPNAERKSLIKKWVKN